MRIGSVTVQYRLLQVEVYPVLKQIVDLPESVLERIFFRLLEDYLLLRQGLLGLVGMRAHVSVLNVSRKNNGHL